MSLLESGQEHINHLESDLESSREHAGQLASALKSGQEHIDHLEIKVEKAIADFRGLEAEFARYREKWLVRACHRAARLLGV